MLNFITNSKSSWMLILLAVVYAITAAALKQVPNWGGIIYLGIVVLYFYVISELYFKFRGEPLHPWDAFRFAFFGFLAMFPVLILDLLPYIPFYALGMENSNNPIVELLLSPFSIFFKLWLGLGILLSIYEKDQVGAMRRSWNLIKKHFRDFLPVLIVIALFSYYVIAVNFFFKQEWVQLALTAPISQTVDSIILPYMFFERFKKLLVS